MIALAIISVSFTFAQETHDSADNAAALLDKGISLFNTYQYPEANRVLREARKKKGQLTAEQQKQVETYLNEAVLAQTKASEATEILADANARFARLDELSPKELLVLDLQYQKVMRAKKYLPPETVGEVQTALSKIAEKRTVVSSAAMSTEKPAAIALPTELILSTATQPSIEQRTNPGSSAAAVNVQVNPIQPGLLSDLEQNRQILRQQAVANFNDAVRQAQEAVKGKKFLAARDAASKARQAIFSSRQLFSVEELERFNLEIGTLLSYIDSAEQTSGRQEKTAQTIEAGGLMLQHQAEAQQERLNKIRELFGEAYELKREKKYDQAIDKARQILAIDPRFDYAKLFIDDTEDQMSLHEQKEIHESATAQERNIRVEAEEMRREAEGDVRYPSDWDERVKRRERIAEEMGMGGAVITPMRKTRRLLDLATVKDLSSLKDGTLQVALDFIKSAAKDYLKSGTLKSATKVETLNVYVDPEVDTTEPINFGSLGNLQDVTLRVVLEMLLKSFAGDVNYAINMDGIIEIAATDKLKEMGLKPQLGRQFREKSYNIADLMLPYPSGETPTISSGITSGSTTGTGGTSGSLIGGGTGGTSSTESPYGETEQISDLPDWLRDNIPLLIGGPEAWAPTLEGNEPSVRVWRRTSLIINQTPAIHEEIAEFLDSLRKTQTVQISIEARFVAVSSNFLERVGLDVDMALNQSRAGYDFTGTENNFGGAAAGSGMRQVQPRNFSYYGLPAVPGVGAVEPPIGYSQPYGHPGLIPTGNSGPKSGQFTSVPVLNNTNTLVTTPSTGVPGNLADSAVRPAFQVMGAFLDDLQVNFLLEATQMDKYSSIVQAPSVVLQNGARARLVVATVVWYLSEIRIVTGEGSAGASAPPAQQLNIGTTLDVMASTHDLKYVSLYLNPSIQELAPEGDLLVTLPVVADNAVGEVRYRYPGTRQRLVETTVSVPDGGTLLVGGLKQTGEIETEAGVPMLSKLPVLRRLFSNRAMTKDSWTLLVLVKPKILLRSEYEPGYAGGGFQPED